MKRLAIATLFGVVAGAICATLTASGHLLTLCRSLPKGTGSQNCSSVPTQRWKPLYKRRRQSYNPKGSRLPCVF